MEYKDKFLQMVFSSNNFKDVDSMLQEYCFNYTNDRNKYHKLKNELTIKYLSIAKERNQGKHFLEKLLTNSTFLEYEVLDYILEQKLDMNFKSYTTYGDKTTLKNHLARTIKNPKNMNTFLKKIKNEKEFKFIDISYDWYIDFCIQSRILFTCFKN